jgi:hypothetical protein
MCFQLPCVCLANQNLCFVSTEKSIPFFVIHHQPKVCFFTVQIYLRPSTCEYIIGTIQILVKF